MRNYIRVEWALLLTTRKLAYHVKKQIKTRNYFTKFTNKFSKLQKKNRRSITQRYLNDVKINMVRQVTI